MPVAPGRDRYASQALGTLHSRIKEATVLLVGAGGIGCELLKNLVLTGYGSIHLVDLDTIDLSNLNRQFLFRQEHIKRPKALVAKESASKFNPNVKITAHHANIKDAQFNLEWFKQFNIVFNALDNLDARRHVNKMCLMADVPLIESGTTGFNGQVQVIQKGKTECYDCNVKEPPKSYPVCTIRSTPSQPIHCIVWAKSYLFTEIFGVGEDQAVELDHSEDADNKEELATLRQETQALKSIRESLGAEKFARLVFNKVFRADVERLQSMDDVWKSKSRTPPKPLDFEELAESSLTVELDIARRDQITWTVEQNFAVFIDSIRRLSKRVQSLRAKPTDGDSPATLSFDKDDDDTLDFVASSANLRSHIFGIAMRSKFDIKQMAGNIIPAIATTNAMAAGICVLQAFKVMRNELERARMVFLVRSVDRVVSSEPLRPPKHDCPVCSVAQSDLIVDTSRATLNDLVEGILRLKFGYGAEFSISGDSGLVYDPELEDNLPKKFSDLGITGDSFITVIDEDDDDPRVNLVLSISDKTLPEDSKPVLAPETLEVARKSKSDQINGRLSSQQTIASGVGEKRKRAPDQNDETNPTTTAATADDANPPSKRGKLAISNGTTSVDCNDDLILVGAPSSNSSNGAIVIDD